MQKIPPPINNKAKARRRRYRLHTATKEFARINAASRSVFVTEEQLDGLSLRQLKVIGELRDVFKYNIQFEIR